MLCGAECFIQCIFDRGGICNSSGLFNCEHDHFHRVSTCHSIWSSSKISNLPSTVFKARIDESSSSSRSSSIIGTSWDRVCLQVSVRYVLPVAMICAIILYHGTKYLGEVTSQGCWGNFFYTSPLSKSRTANWLQNRWLITIQSRISRCHCTLLWECQGGKMRRLHCEWCIYYRWHNIKY